MKKILFLIMSVGCSVGLAFGSNPILQNDFRVKSSIGDFPTVNTLLRTEGKILSNMTSAKSSVVAAESNRNNCSTPPIPGDDEATMSPSCVDTTGGDDPPGGPHGDSQKGALPFSPAQNLAVQYYKLNPITDVYEISDAKSLVSYENGGYRFYYEYPTWDGEEGNTFYKIEVIDRAASGDGYITHGILEMVYPTN